MNNSPRKFSACRTIALLGVLGLIIGMIVPWQLSIFVYGPSLMSFGITFGFTFFLLLATFGKDYLKFIPDSILTLFTVPEKPVPRYADICRFGSRYAIAGAGIGTLIICIQRMSSIEDPSCIGVGMAYTLLPTFWALILAEVFFAILYKAYSDGAKSETAPPLSTNNLAIAIIILVLVAATFFGLIFGATWWR